MHMMDIIVFKKTHDFGTRIASVSRSIGEGTAGEPSPSEAPSRALRYQQILRLPAPSFPDFDICDKTVETNIRYGNNANRWVNRKRIFCDKDAPCASKH